MGTGKTYTAGAVIRARNEPTLVVCPAVSITSWRRMGAALGVGFSILNYEKLRTGNTPYGQWENPPPPIREVTYRCENCQLKLNPGGFSRLGMLFPATRNPPCPHHYLGIHCVKTEKKKHNYGKFIFNSAVKFAAFDEVHRCGGLDDSLQSAMRLACRRQRIPTLGLSATVAESPLDLRALGAVLRLHNLTDYYSWAAKHGCRRTPDRGFQFLLGDERKRQVMAELHTEIFPSRGTRVRITDLGSAFPEVQIRAELYDLEGSGRIDELYAEMDEALAALAERSLGDVELAITTLLRKRQEIELLTVPIYEELTNDALRSGLHVALFVNFRQTVDELCRRLKTKCRIDGSQVGEKGARARRACMDAFQADEEPVIVCSAAAGGISIDLHDVRGYFPRLGLVAPGFDAVQFRQIFGRLRRANALSKALYRVILCAGTVQEKIHKALSGKLDCMDLLNDGDLLAGHNLPLTAMDLNTILQSRI